MRSHRKGPNPGPRHPRLAGFPPLPSEVPSRPVQLAPRRRIHSVQPQGSGVPPPDRPRVRQARGGLLRVSGRGVGLPKDGGAVPAEGAEQVGGPLAGSAALGPSDDAHHLDVGHLVCWFECRLCVREDDRVPVVSTGQFLKFRHPFPRLAKCNK